jgi:inner membrane protein
VRVPVTAQAPETGVYTFAFDLDLNGSQALRFVPLGRETNVQLASTWATPSFDGAFLPDERTVTDDGFSSDWRVLHLNRNYPQQWRGTSVALNESAFGVTLLVPVDQYQKSMRAAKYAILVIALTFLVFFFAEIRNRERVHPFQYILVGLALCLFYTLLLAASEQVAFNLAYVVAGLATIGLVTAYTRSIFASRTLSLLTGGVLLVLYGFVFVILQLQDFALLVGSIGLFVALALTMYLSRNIDWYRLSQND